MDLRSKFDDQPRTLQRAHCEICDGTFTVVKGQCTGCIRREGNRKQGVVYIVFGVLLGLFGAWMFQPGLTIVASVILMISGLGFTIRGLKAVVFGRSAE